MEKQSKISLNLILAGLFGWLLLANGCGKPAGSDKVATKGTALGDKAGGEPCEDCVSPGSRSALLLAAAKNQQSNADPANIADPIIEKAIRRELKKPTGELTKADLEKVTRLDLKDTKTTDVGLKEVIKCKKLEYLGLHRTQVTNEGLKEVAKFTRLRRVGLNGTQVTDMGLKELVNLQELEELWVRDTKVTRAGVLQLQKALPRCCFYYKTIE